MTKQELRKHIRTLKNKYLTGEPTPCEVRLTEHLPACKVVMLYCALPDEVPTQGVMDELVARRWNCADMLATRICDKELMASWSRQVRYSLTMTPST